MTLLDYFAENPKLKSQWVADRNAILSHAVSTRSREKVWWKCSEGHVWQAAIFSRTRKKGTGCPVCAGTVKASQNKRAKPRKMDQRSLRV